MKESEEKEMFDSNSQKALIEEAVNKLRAACFVRVDGLEYSSPNKEDKDIIEVKDVRHLSKHDTNNSVCAVTLPDGQIWIHISDETAQKCAEEICPERGCFVPMSNGEVVSPYHLLFRLSDPNWKPKVR